MAPRWLSSRQSSWAGSDASPNTALQLTVGGLALLVVGALLGAGLTALLSDDTPKQTESAIANPTTSDIRLAPHTADGAVRAVTSYITGFPSVALQSTDEQQAVLNDIISPNADPTLRNQLANSLITARTSLIGSGALGSSLQARLVVSPASYKVDMLSKDRARVQVWFLNVYIDAKNQVAQSSWATNDIQVQWTDHWRIATFYGKGGPTPALFSESTKPSSFSDVLSVFNGFQAYRYATSNPQP